MRRRSILALLGVVSLSGAGIVVAIRNSGDGQPPAAPTAAGSIGSPSVPGVVLICLDTLRADALALDSGRQVRMPILEAFARESVAFADAVSGAAWTCPSVAILLTGLDSDHNGVHGLPERYTDMTPAVTTLAERLRDRGWYASCATTGGWLAPDSGLAQGFRDGVVGLDVNPQAVIAAWNRRRPADVPFFFFVHSLAAHDPYLDKNTTAQTAPPVSSEDADRLLRLKAQLNRGSTALDSADMRWLAGSALESKSLWSAQARTLGAEAAGRLMDQAPYWFDSGCEIDPLVPALGARLHAVYTQSLADVDRLVGRIFDGLDRLNLPAGTVIVVAGDHGEAFAEHGTLMHGRRLHDEMIRVPLLIRAPSRLGRSRVVHGPCGLVDVTPTILDLCGVPDASKFDGISLVASSAAALPERALRGLEERRRLVDREMRFERIESVRTTRAKCIVRRDPVDRHVLSADMFDLLVDPLEQHPIPFEANDRPCEFGDTFAAALKEMGLDVRCRGAATESSTTPSRPGG